MGTVMVGSEIHRFLKLCTGLCYKTNNKTPNKEIKK